MTIENATGANAGHQVQAGRVQYMDLRIPVFRDFRGQNLDAFLAQAAHRLAQGVDTGTQGDGFAHAEAPRWIDFAELLGGTLIARPRGAEPALGPGFGLGTRPIG